MIAAAAMALSSLSVTTNANRLRTYQRPALAAVAEAGNEHQTIVEVQRYEPEMEKGMTTVKDVVCGMDIDPNTTSSKMEYRGQTYHFCSSACHEKFMAGPETYADQETITDVQSDQPEEEKNMATVKDVVCGMDIDPSTASSKIEHQGKTYHFCSSACHTKFMAEAQKYAS